MKLRVKNFEEGRIVDCLTGEGAAYIGIIMDSETGDLIKAMAQSGARLKAGECFPIYFHLTDMEFHRDPKKIYLKGHFVKDHRGHDITDEISSRTFAGYYNLDECCGEFEEVLE